jgi:hypothetical protein
VNTSEAEKRIDHCALGWGLHPQCGYSNGTILFNKKADLLLNGEYYKHDPENYDAWPIDPETGEKLPVEPFEKEAKPSLGVEVFVAIVFVMAFGVLPLGGMLFLFHLEGWL